MRPLAAGCRLVGLCDSSFGYGTPQLELLMGSLADFYRAGECWLIEPDVKRKPLLAADPRFRYRRFATRFPPHVDAYQIEYNLQIGGFLDRHPADLIVVTCAWLMPAVLRSRRPPSFVIYHWLEGLDYQRQIAGSDVVLLHQLARHRIDLICVPELTRARFDLDWLGWREEDRDRPVVELLNIAPGRPSPAAAPREPRIIFAGSVSEATLCHHLADASLDDTAIDVFGILDSDRIRKLFAELAQRGSRVVYRTSLSLSELDEIYPRYAYSLVMWRPDTVSQILASPNKFFQSIAHGVPPICAPHPQCVKYVRKYGCGLLADDWSRGAITRAIHRAMTLFGTSAYDRMVANCREAQRLELNWPAQFDKLLPYLPPPEEPSRPG